MLQIKNLTVTHRKDLRTMIKNFSWVLNPGDKAVIIGEEGNGKSTLLKLIYDPELVCSYMEYSGEIIRDNQRLGYLAQELEEKYYGMALMEYFQSSEAFLDRAWSELSEIAVQLRLPVDIFYSEQRIGSLSGGEKVKIQLARLLSERPDVLLLDEPSNDLDIETLEWLENFIHTCGLPVIFVSHDETLIERTTNVIIHLELLRRKTLPRATVARMPYAEYVSTRLAKMEHQTQVARKEREEYARQQERYQRIAQKVEHQQSAVSRQDPHGGRLLKKKMHAVKSMGRRFDREYEEMTGFPDSEEAIMPRWAESVRIPNGKRIVDLTVTAAEMYDLCGKKFDNDLRLEVIGPQKVCIIGNNGAGKTTFLRKTAQQLLERTDIHAAYMPQNYEELLDFTKTPVEFLCKLGDREEISKVRTFLGTMKYTPEEMDHAMGHLSGGQKAKLFFVKMILDGADVLILDEPTRNFSPLSAPVLRQLLQEFSGAVISISHDRKYIDEVCDRLYLLDKEGLRLLKSSRRPE